MAQLRYYLTAIFFGRFYFPLHFSTQSCTNLLWKSLTKAITIFNNKKDHYHVSDQSINFPFPSWFQKANYEDPNFQVNMPIFSIHGNHDDPAGDGRLAALDVVATANLVNYFGQADNIDDITVYPILFEKGTTQVAVYGLGNIRDERLYHTFQQKKVRFLNPTAESGEWFKIFVLHQNRVHRAQKNCIQEQMIPDMFDVVIWGHEHECRITPEQSSISSYHIIQPGSSVATSLCESESRPKHVVSWKLKERNGVFIPSD